MMNRRLNIRSRYHATAPAILLTICALNAMLAGPVFAQNIGLGNLELTLSRPVFNNTSSGLRFPTAFETPNDGSGDFYISGLAGRIHKFQNGVEMSATPFLNIPSVRTGSGSGFLGMIFHPDFSNVGTPGYHKLYTYHSENVSSGGTPTFVVPGTTTILYNVVSEWQVSSSNSNVVDMTTRREIYREAHPTDENHNGGALDFGPGGYMYITTGVPPGAFALAQDLDNILGKVLRIDPIHPSLKPTSLDAPSANGQYRIPVSNPFVSTPSALDEIYAYGLRNPYRMSVDPVSGLVFLGDVGQSSREEVNAFSAGANLGWPHREGFIAGPISPDPPIPTFTDPIADYTQADGNSVTGGFMYHGSIPELKGKYVFGDFLLNGSLPFGSPGRVFWLDPFDGDGNLKDPSEIEIHEFRYSASTHAIFDSFSPDVGDNIDIAIYSFGIDDDGEIYIQGEEANKLTIYKITGATNLSPPGDFDGDLDVDHDDLVQWQDDFGDNDNSDADGDGDSDGRDFLIWQRNYGTGVPLSASTTVPEPSAIALVCAALGTLAFSRRRRLG